MNVKSVTQSLREAAESTAARKATIAALLDTKVSIGNWTRQNLAGDIFWTNGKKWLSSRQLLEKLGTKLVTMGALAEAEYYG